MKDLSMTTADDTEEKQGQVDQNVTSEADPSPEEIWAELEREEAGKSEDMHDAKPDDEPNPPEEDDADPDPDPHHTPGDPDSVDAETLLLRENQQLRSTIKGQGRKISSLLKERDRLTSATTTSDEEVEERRRRMEEASEEYGDIVAPFSDSINALEKTVATINQDRAARVGEIDTEIEEIAAAEFAVLTEAHPDFAKVYSENRSVFDAWIEDQPKAIRDAHAANVDRWTDGAGAAMVMTKFKSALQQASGDGVNEPEKQNGQAKRDRQLQGSRATNTGGRQAATGKLDPNTDDRQAIWDEFEREDQQKAKNRGW